MDAVKSFNELILEAVDEALLAFGKETRTLIYNHLETNHHVSREGIPLNLEALHDTLTTMLGTGLNTVEKLVEEELSYKLGFDFRKCNGRNLIDYVASCRKTNDSR